MLFVPLGATDVIGASCHYVQIDGTGLLLDAGVDPEEDGEASLPRLDLVANRADWFVDHCLISHAHHDHIGALPIVVRDFPHVRVHMTRETRELVDLLLPASARLQRRKLREGSTVASPLFDEEETASVSYVYEVHRFDEWFDVTGVRGNTKVQARFLYAGHILGSAGVELAFDSEGRTKHFFFTGDTNASPQTIIPGGDYPDRVDVLALETTTGTDDVAENVSRKSEERRLGESINAVLQRGGSVLIPVFALGRAQEILALVDRFKRRQHIPPETEIYTAGSMRAIASIYDETRFATPRLNEDFEVAMVDQKRVPRSTDSIRDALAKPSIFVVASGMMFERTLSNTIAQLIIEEEKSAIFLVGYCAPESPGGRLEAAAEAGYDKVVLEADRGVQTLKCQVLRFRLSGHSNRRDLLDLVGRMDPKKVVLIHGDADSLEWMSDNMRYFYPDKEVIVPDIGEPITL